MLPINETGETNGDAGEVLVKGEWSHFNSLTAYFTRCWIKNWVHENHLDDNGEDNDEEEHGVIEEAIEDIDFSGLEFAAIDLIEDLEEHKAVEEERVMDGCLLTVVLMGSDWRGHSEKAWTEEEQGGQHYELPHRLTDDISPHGGSYHSLVTSYRFAI